MLCKCSGKYIDIYFNLKIAYVYTFIQHSWIFFFSLSSIIGSRMHSVLLLLFSKSPVEFSY